MEIVGPTRFGKGVVVGGLMDQAIRNGDTVFYIDPKNDRWAPHVMYQAAKEAGRPFVYLSLHDHEIGSWAPFEGGPARDAMSRAEVAFGLEYTGDPGTDFYKTHERNALEEALAKTRSVKGLLNELQTNEHANKLRAMLKSWARLKSLCPSRGGFSIEKALLDNAVVFVRGSLLDGVIRPATKIFILELVQETMRLKTQRTSHLTLIVDEVAFLVSKQLADSLATIAGFNANIVTLFQSVKDLTSPDDRTLDGDAILQRVNTNSQLKMLFGGADIETAEWIATLSGSIQKEVTKLERTEIKASGGEIWEKNRTVGQLEENLIPINVILTLPPRVGVLLQPGQLATVCFTSHVPVDESELGKFLASKAPTLEHEPGEAESCTVPGGFDLSIVRNFRDEATAAVINQPRGKKAEEPAVSLAKPDPSEEALAEKRKLKNKERKERQKQKRTDMATKTTETNVASKQGTNLNPVSLAKLGGPQEPTAIAGESVAGVEI